MCICVLCVYRPVDTKNRSCSVRVNDGGDCEYPSSTKSGMSERVVEREREREGGGESRQTDKECLESFESLLF